MIGGLGGESSVRDLERVYKSLYCNMIAHGLDLNRLVFVLIK